MTGSSGVETDTVGAGAGGSSGVATGSGGACGMLAATVAVAADAVCCTASAVWSCAGAGLDTAVETGRDACSGTAAAAGLDAEPEPSVTGLARCCCGP